MFSKISKTRKSFIGAIMMSLILLMGSALGFLLETKLGQIMPSSSDSWANYTAVPTGAGTDGNPYTITKAEELAWVAENGVGANVELSSDIDLGAHEWQPIQLSKIAKLEGNNHTINNLNINKPNDTFVGFFYECDGIIQNIKFSNVQVVGRSHVGAVCASGHFKANNVSVTSGSVFASVNVAGGVFAYAGAGSTINNCTNNAEVVSTNSAAGIVCHKENGGIIENCINTGNITGESDVGGIVGIRSGQFLTIKNCYAECSISGNAETGGIVGFYNDLMSGADTIENCGFMGSIAVSDPNSSYIGSLVGRNDSSAYPINIKNCFAVTDIYLKQRTDVDGVQQFGAPSWSNFESTYSYSNVYTKGGRTQYRIYKVRAAETEPFSEFAYHENINGGYPFPRSLFAVGQFIECDTMSYLEEYGFEGTRIKNDGTHYYVELGYYPQTYVGDSLNATLKSWYISSKPTSVDSYTNDTGTSGTVTHYAYKYTDGEVYVRVVSAATYSSGYTFQNGTTAVSGTEYWFKVEPIKWWVLNYNDVMNNGASPIVLSEQALTANISWNKSESDKNLWSGTCNIRTWLNGTFYNDAFSIFSRANIKTTTVKNNTYSDSYIDGEGMDTQDNVWLLSTSELSTGVFEYLNTKVKRYCSPTDYALVNKSRINISTSYPTAARPNGGITSYWQRTTHASNTVYARVCYDGDFSGANITDCHHAVRPAMTLDM